MHELRSSHMLCESLNLQRSTRDRTPDLALTRQDDEVLLLQAGQSWLETAQSEVLAQCEIQAKVSA